jgi:hypothetical protein
MSAVGRADANGGSGSAAASAAAVGPDKQDAGQSVPVKTPGRGHAAHGQNTWSKVPAQPGEKPKGAQVSGDPAQATPRQFATDKGLTQLIAAVHERDVALQRENKEHFSQHSVDAYRAASEKVREAQSKLGADIKGADIKRETDKLSCPSVISPEMRNVDDVRKVEASIVSGVPEDRQAYVSNVIRDNQKARLPIAMRTLSEKVTTNNGELTRESSQEGLAIIADAIDWVAGPRADDGSSPAEIKAKQFERLRDFVGSTLKNNGKFDETLATSVIIQCADAMGISGEREFETLGNIVGARNYPGVDDWIAANLYQELEVKKR